MGKAGIQVLTMGMATLLFLACGENEQIRSSMADRTNGMDHLYEGVEFDMPRVRETSFPDLEVSIVDFGARGDGLYSNTKAFADAIDEVHQKGGGRVSVPRGMWLTGPIALKSNINLHL